MNKEFLKKLGKSLLRIVAALAILQGISASPRKNEANGIAIYCEWEMDENKWQIWRKFIR